jgi:hypothetical protein
MLILCRHFDRSLEKQIQAIFGWETLQQVERYTRKARAKKLAGDSMHLLVAQD